MSKKTGQKEGFKQLANLDQLRRFSAHLINRRNLNQISGAKARDLGFLIKIHMEILKASDIEQRIAALEERLEKTP